MSQCRLERSRGLSKMKLGRLACLLRLCKHNSHCQQERSIFLDLSGTGDSRESFAIETPIFIARQADSHESLEFPIRANHATKSLTLDHDRSFSFSLRVK